MRFLTALSTLSLVALAAAQNSSNDSTPLVVQVGAASTTSGGPLQFTPPSINATKGSVVTFMFTGSPGNHTITQSTFQNPCTPMTGGFSSGFVFIPPNTTTGFPVWNLTIEDDATPIWFFCAQTAPVPHCGSGMVGVINAPTTGNTFSLFQNAAKALNGTSPPTPSGALNGSGAAASLLPGPLTGSIVGFDLPSGSAPTPTVPASSGASGAASGSGSAPNATKTASDASVLVASGFVGMVSALLGILLI